MAEQKLRTIHKGEKGVNIEVDEDDIFYITRNNNILAIANNLVDAMTELINGEYAETKEISLDELGCFISDKHRRIIKKHAITICLVEDMDGIYYEIYMNGEKEEFYYSPLEVRAFLDGLCAITHLMI